MATAYTLIMIISMSIPQADRALVAALSAKNAAWNRWEETGSDADFAAWREAKRAWAHTVVQARWSHAVAVK